MKAKATNTHRLATSNPGVVTTTAGGVARNIAHNLARLGANVALISAVGVDSYGDMLLRHTEMVGVDIASVQRVNLATGTYVAMLDHEGELISAVSDMTILKSLTPEVIAERAAMLEGAKFIVADCNLPLATLLALAEQYGRKLIIETVSVEKSGKLGLVLKKGGLFAATPNLDQLEAMIGTRDFTTSFQRLHDSGLSNVVLHAGAEGAFVSDGKAIEHAEPIAGSRIIDVTGAGDAAVAGLVFGLVQGENIFDAARLGQSLASRVIATDKSTLE